MSSFCHYYNSKTCLSCNKIALDYSDQLNLKEEKLLSSLSFFKNINLIKTTSSQTHGFRHKAKMVVSGSLENPIISIPTELNSDHPKEILDCPIHHPEINKILFSMVGFIKECKLNPYNLNIKKGELKGLIIYYSEETHEAYLRIILRSKESIDRIKKNILSLTSIFSSLKCISINIQPKHAAVLEGDEEIFLTDQHYIHHQLGEIKFSLHPKAFVQTNPRIAHSLYITASNWIRDLNTETLVEIFCGQGAFSFFCAEHTKSSVGFEINKEAVEQANLTAKLYQKSNLTFKVADAKNLSEEIFKLKPDVLLVNPPRKGLGESIKVILQNKPPYILYSSCSVETLASDLKQLMHLYQIEKSQIFDMFPHTDHFETLVLLKSTF